MLMISTFSFRFYCMHFMFATLLLWIFNWDIRVSANCIWYGQCGINAFNKLPLYCPYDGPAIALTNETAKEQLRAFCPDLINDNGETLTCCAPDQISTVHEKKYINNVKYIIERCPACWHNFLRYYCAMLCSSNQHQFMYPETIVKNETTMNDTITAVKLYLSESLVDTMFKSCYDVISPFGPALSTLCERDIKDCTGPIWVQSMGKSNFSPILFNVIISDKVNISENGLVFNPMSLKMHKCHESVMPGEPSCTCSDCKAVCKNVIPAFDLPDPSISAKFMIGERDGMIIVAAILYIVLISLFFIGLVIKEWRKYMKRNKQKLENSDNQAPDGDEAKEKKQQIDSEVTDEEAIFEPIKESLYTKFTFILDDGVERFFIRWGTLCASYPFTVIFIGLVIGCCVSLGLIFFTVTTSPIDLWVMSDSQAKLESDYYNSHFQPFLRTQQLIMHPKRPGIFKQNDKWYSVVFKREFLKEAYKLQRYIELLTVSVNERVITLSDVCFKPLAPDNTNCSTFSIVDIFKNKTTLFDSNFDHISHLTTCFGSPLIPSCLAPYGGPILPFIALGGVQDGNYARAKVLVTTFFINDYQNSSKHESVLTWESRYLSFLQKYKSPMMNIYFVASRSVEDEFEKESKSDMSTIAISYLVMLVYISISLGHITSLRRLFVDSKFFLGISGVLIVILSVSMSVGIFSVINVPATLIVVTVVPFLVLSVGVDNIFILVKAYQRDERKLNETRQQQIGRVFGHVASSMMLSSVTDAAGFFLSAILSSMPAVRTFALYAGVALIVAFLFQITCFISVFSLDTQREEANRFDVCCCLKTIHARSGTLKPGVVYTVIEKIYAPFLMKSYVRYIVILLFPLWFCSSVALINKIDVGLEQEFATSKDSYLNRYLGAVKQFLDVGPPVFFVVKAGYNYSSWKGQSAICKGPECDQKSILSQLSFARQHSNKTFIAQDAFSWLDDYLAWITTPDCCRQHNTTKEFCSSMNHSCVLCNPLVKDVGGFKHIFGSQFETFLPAFLKDNPTADGCFGGHAFHGNNVEMLPNGQVGATSFLSFQSTLKTSRDYYEALWYGRYISKKMTEFLNQKLANGKKNFEVFCYSFFHVFYEQYLTMWHDTMFNLLYGFICIFIISFFLLGMSFILALITITSILMIIVNLMGMMYWWNVQLNAISLVNLVVAVGIAVEFCSHIIHSFSVSQAETNVLRAKEALTSMGSSVFAGVTLTKFTGVCVFAFSNSQIFQVFYFRINLCIVLFGAAHGLIFLPVLLSFFGPSVNKRKIYIQQQRALLLQRSLARQHPINEEN